MTGLAVLHLPTGERGIVRSVRFDAGRWSLLVELGPIGARGIQTAGLLRAWDAEDAQVEE